MCWISQKELWWVFLLPEWSSSSSFAHSSPDSPEDLSAIWQHIFTKCMHIWFYACRKCVFMPVPNMSVKYCFHSMHRSEQGLDVVLLMPILFHFYQYSQKNTKFLFFRRSRFVPIHPQLDVHFFSGNSIENLLHIEEGTDDMRSWIKQFITSYIHMIRYYLRKMATTNTFSIIAVWSCTRILPLTLICTYFRGFMWWINNRKWEILTWKYLILHQNLR